MTKTKLSVVVITKNEENRLRECLQSVAGWADEIVVVDDCSTDRTLEIAKEFTPSTHKRTMDIEGKHRNYAYSLARNEWVLSLDADERMTPELRDEISALLNAGPSCNGYTIPRKNFMGDTWVRYGGMYPSAQLRFFKKDKFKYDEFAEVHPQAYMPDPRGARGAPPLPSSRSPARAFRSPRPPRTSPAPSAPPGAAMRRRRRRTSTGSRRCARR